MEDYILSVAERLLKDAPKRTFFKDLRLSCDELIKKLKARPEDAKQDVDGNKYFYLMREALDTKHPRLMDVALDAIHYLMENEFLFGDKDLSEQARADLAVLPHTQHIVTLLDLILYKVCVCADDNDDGRHGRVLKTILTAIDSNRLDVHGGTLLFCVQTCFQVALMTKSSITRTSAEKAITSIFDTTSRRMEEAHSDDKDAQSLLVIPPAPPSNPEELLPIAEDGGGEERDMDRDEGDEGETKDDEEQHLHFDSVWHKDVYVLFRHVCALSMKESKQEDVVSHTDSVALHSKMLSLEVVLHVLKRSGLGFKSGACFVHAVQRYLCVSLLGNCTSPVAAITGLSLHIFGTLMTTFKEHMKHELEVFITNIFLRILESENSTFDHKRAVLEVFHQLCNDHDALVEIFINYDCDLQEIDLFRRIIDALAKIAKNPSFMANKTQGLDFMNSGRKLAEEEKGIRAECLTALVGILTSLRATSSLSNTKDGSSGDLERMGSEDGTNARATSDDYSVNTFDPGSPMPEASMSPSPSSGTVVEAFDKKKRLQSEIETGILKFNLSPRKGLAYLSDLGHIKYTPRGVARFLQQYNDRLDKTVLGDFLGREREYLDGFCVKVLHEFVDDMDFAGMLFDDAIRRYLSVFRLPGEAQKIDRIMEKFAERFFLQNRSVFASADMAFILAFSTIMLQTNLHNPAIRDDKRMTKEQFVKQNKGISADGEIPDDMLVGIYDRIAANKIALHGDEDKAAKKGPEVSFSISFNGAATRRKSAFFDERKEMVRASEAMFREKSKRRNSDPRSRKLFQTANGAMVHVQYVKPMLEVAWPAMMAVFSQVLESHDDVMLTDLCLDGLAQLTTLCARLDLPVGRNAFINCLCKCTTLESIKPLLQKNVEAIRRMLSVALSEGDYIGENWLQVLHCISQLSRLQSIASSSSSVDLFQGKSLSPARRATKGGNQLTKLFSGPSKAEVNALVEEANSEIVDVEIDPVLVDRVYIKSTAFRTDSICAFVEALCEVSLMEISSEYKTGTLRNDLREVESPRVFSLQKLVEVSDSNMFIRSRLEWTRMWGALGAHFCKVGIHKNMAVAMVAIDALKQLSIKFLQKEELSNFNFQRLFLKPFETILGKSESGEIQELILGCVDVIVRSYSINLRSGWRTVLSTLAAAAQSVHDKTIETAFHIVSFLLKEKFDFLINDFVDVMNCLTAFALCPETDISKKTLQHMADMVVRLASNDYDVAALASPSSSSNLLNNGVTATPPASPGAGIGGSTESNTGAPTAGGAESTVFRLWWPLLMGLSTLVGDPRLIIRLHALELLKDTILNHKDLFAQTWGLIFKGVLFPMIESAKVDETSQPESRWPIENPSPSTDPGSWIATTASPVFMAIIEVYCALESAQATELLPEVMNLFEGCISQEMESLARLALRAYNDLLLLLGGAAGTMGRQGEERPLAAHLLSVVATRTTRCMRNNLGVDFGAAGHLDMRSVPDEVTQMLTRCPVRQRRPSDLERELSESSVGRRVSTSFGEGVVREVLPEMEGVVRRQRVEMKSWTASLYTRDELTMTGVEAGTIAEAVEEERWLGVKRSSMTSMVTSLDLNRLLGELMHVYYSSWGSDELSAFLNTFWAVHHHARAFNEDLSLRASLHRRGLMHFPDAPRRLPHLLDAEVQSVTQLIVLCFRLFADDANPTGQALARPWVEIVTTDMLQRYIKLEALAEELPDDEAPETLEHKSFQYKMRDAYTSPVAIVLRSIVQMKAPHFKLCASWLLPLLSALTIATDVTVRRCNKEILDALVVPLALEAAKK